MCLQDEQDEQEETFGLAHGGIHGPQAQLVEVPLIPLNSIILKHVQSHVGINPH